MTVSHARRSFPSRLRPRLARLLTPLADMPPGWLGDAPLRQANAVLTLARLRADERPIACSTP